MALIASAPAFAASVNVGFTAQVRAASDQIALAPATGIARTFADHAALTITLANPTNHKRTIALSSHDAHLAPVYDIRLPTEVTLAPGESRIVAVHAAMNNQTTRRFQICASDGAMRRCGRYIAKRH